MGKSSDRNGGANSLPWLPERKPDIPLPNFKTQYKCNQTGHGFESHMIFPLNILEVPAATFDRRMKHPAVQQNTHRNIPLFQWGENYRY